MNVRLRNAGIFVAFITVVSFGIDSVIAQQSFSCPYGKNASCLDYGDKVCSSFAKCVDESATCFSQYTCGYDGFICKSEYNEVVDSYNSVLRKNKSLVSDYNSLLYEHQENVSDYNNLLSAHSELKSCISYADSLEAAQDCAW